MNGLRISFPLALLALFVVTTVAVGARANGLVVPGDAETTPVLAPLSSMQARVALTDAGAEYSEVRRYTVSSGATTFYRSLPSGRSSVEATLGGEPLLGRILEPAEADAERERLALLLGDPAPLRELGTPLFVSDIAPVGTVEVTFEMQVPLTEYGTLRGIRVAMDWSRGPVGDFDLEVTATTEAPLRALYAPNHDLAVQRIGEHEAVGRFSRRDVYTELDLTVLFSTGAEPVRLDLLPFRYEPDGPGYVLVLLSPELAASDVDISPRDLVFAFDTSGSMSGEKIIQAKDALTTVLEGLSPRDSFAIVTFSTEVTIFRPQAVAADSANVAEALDFVDSLTADGSTNIHGALSAAFDALPTGGERARYVVLLTDGQPTAGDTSIDGILQVARQRREHEARIFSFGVGYDVNTVLLDRLAGESSGDAFYVQPGDSVAVAVTTFFDQIRDPLLVSPELDVSAFGVSNPYPEKLQDLFAGVTTLVAGRYTNPGAGTISLSGSRAGTPVEVVYDVTLPKADARIGNVPRVWALRHLGALFEELKLGASTNVADQALETATRFGVGTEFTSFVLNADGDTVMTYSEVPVDAVGERAVGTSTLLDGYTKSSSYSTYVSADVRYLGDRAFPLQGGYYTDSSLGERDDWIDLSFGSALYYELAYSESYPNAAAFLSVASNVKFELGGRAFRVTSESWPLASTNGLPPESDAIPGPLFELGGSGETTVLPNDAELPAAMPNDDEKGEALLASPGATDRDPNGGDPHSPGVGCGCRVDRGTAPGSSALRALWPLGLALMLRARRRRFGWQRAVG